MLSNIVLMGGGGSIIAGSPCHRIMVPAAVTHKESLHVNQWPSKNEFVHEYEAIAAINGEAMKDMYGGGWSQRPRWYPCEEHEQADSNTFPRTESEHGTASHGVFADEIFCFALPKGSIRFRWKCRRRKLLPGVPPGETSKNALGSMKTCPYVGCRISTLRFADGHQETEEGDLDVGGLLVSRTWRPQANVASHTGLLMAHCRGAGGLCGCHHCHSSPRCASLCGWVCRGILGWEPRSRLH
jgi:hypothetical protein